MILYIIVTCDLALLVSSVSQPRSSSMSVTLLMFLYLLVAYLAARLCTISIFSLALSVWGLHTFEQYSKLGHTIVKYAEAFVSRLFTRKFHCRKPSMLLPFFTIRFIWGFQDSLEVMSTPRYFDCSSTWRNCPFSE